jgi:hypothetical protein
LSDDFALAARAPAASEKQGFRNAVSRPGEKRLILRALAFKGIQDRRVFQATPVDLIMRSFILLLTCLELAAQMAAQAGTPHFGQPMPMPAGLHRFTEVFFNANHTLALVEEGMWCGSLCGELDVGGAGAQRWPMADDAVGERDCGFINDGPALDRGGFGIS